MLIFSREEGVLNVHEMQVMWYEYETGNAYYRLGNLLKAIEQYKYVDSHFKTI